MRERVRDERELPKSVPSMAARRLLPLPRRDPYKALCDFLVHA